MSEESQAILFVNYQTASEANAVESSPPAMSFQAKRTGTWRRMNMLRFSESKTLNSVMISQM